LLRRFAPRNDAETSDSIFKQPLRCHRPPTGRPNGRPMTGSGERSSIPETPVLDPRGRGVPGCPPSLAMRMRGCASAFSRHEMPKVCVSFAPSKKQRAQGRPGARCTRGLVCKLHRKCAHEHTGSAETLRPSLRDGFTVYLALSPVTGFLPPSPARIASHELDASIGAPGPHDFAVRITHARQSWLSRPPHPTARS
jgi:hypothetical protein